MAAPPKPWEMSGNSSLQRAFIDSNGIGNYESGGVLPQGGLAGAPMLTSAPPALPPRPYVSQSNYGVGSPYTSYSGYSTLANNYGGMYGGYGASYGAGYGGTFGGYGGYGAHPGYNRFNHNMFGDMESRFIQLAEESTRPAFQSIESIVGAVGSVAMMLENTFFAMTSSFRAILGVAENFGRLRTLFAQFWSAFAVFRAINWLLKKLMVMLGLRTQNEFQAWAEAAMQTNGQSENQPSDPNSRGSSWPAILFLAIIGAVPYIIVKMISKINSTIQSNASNPSTWQNPMQALAQYDFQASSPQEMSFRAHQIITIAPQPLQGNLWNSGWLLGSVDGRTSGLVPVNYFKIIRNSTPQLPNQITQKEISEIDQQKIEIDKKEDATPVTNENGS